MNLECPRVWITHVAHQPTKDEALKCNIKINQNQHDFNVATLQHPYLIKSTTLISCLHRVSELPNLADLWSRSDEVNMLPFWEKQNRNSSGNFLTKHSNNICVLNNLLVSNFKFSYHFQFSYIGGNKDHRAEQKSKIHAWLNWPNCRFCWCCWNTPEI